jgi:beta-galactosidase
MAYVIYGSGAVRITTSLRTTDNTQMARFGVDFAMPDGFENIEWFARGPKENLNDRLTGSFASKYKTTVSDNYFPYIKPQDTGTRQDTRYIALTDDAKPVGLLVAATGDRLFESNALHMSWRDINNSTNKYAEPKHPYQLKPIAETIVSVSYGSRGTGGASCGPETLEQYRLVAGNKSYAYTIVPFNKNEADPALLSKYYRNPSLSEAFDLTAVNSASGVTVTVKNNAASEKNVDLILAVYDENGLVSVAKAEVTAPAPSVRAVDFALDLSKYGGLAYKAFAWDGSALIPLAVPAEGSLPPAEVVEN